MIAQVYVDTGVPHLDRPFDYAVPVEWEPSVRPGVRVRVRFNGRLLTGLVVGLADTSEQDKLVPLSRITSAEVVLPAASVALIRAVADHCAGTFMDVARLALPPRYARAESAGRRDDVDPTGPSTGPSPLDRYPDGTGLREAVRSGKSPRAAWTVCPVADEAGDWAAGLAGLAADCVASGRGALLLVPDAKDCVRVLAALGGVVDHRFVVSLSADLGPAARYRAFLAVVRGEARVVVGTRAAAYAPVADLGLIAVWDEADDSFAEPRFPYPALRDIVAIRAGQSRTGVVFASYARSAELQNWADKGWLREVGWPARQAMATAAAIRVASTSSHSLAQDPGARAARLPHDAFTVIRDGLAAGPVLVWVPWLGHRRSFVCPACGETMRCTCGGGFEERTPGAIACQVCGRSADGWRCSCGSSRWWAVTVGSARTAEELAGSFRTVPVIRSDSTNRVDRLPDDPALVIATPGCEPMVSAGYAAAVILDAQSFLSRPDIRASETAVRRWLTAVSFVRPASRGGSVLVVGPGGDRAVQAVMRVDPVGFAARELADRREAGFPPATRMAVFTGDASAMAEIAGSLGEAGYVELLGPVQEIDSDDVRLIARAPAVRGEAFAQLLATLAARRSAAKRPGRVVWRLDPDWLGG